MSGQFCLVRGSCLVPTKGCILASASAMVLFQKGTGAIEVLGLNQQQDLQAANARQPGLALAADFALDSLAVQRSSQDFRLAGKDPTTCCPSIRHSQSNGCATACPAGSGI